MARALGQRQKCAVHQPAVCYGPCVDGSGLARTFFTLQHIGRCGHVFGLFAVLMTAGHNALRGSGPNQKRAFD